MRNVDLENKMVENAQGEMIPFIGTEMKHVDGEQYVMLMVSERAGVAIEIDGWRKIHEPSDEVKAAAAKQALKDNIMSEGYGDY